MAAALTGFLVALAAGTMPPGRHPAARATALSAGSARQVACLDLPMSSAAIAAGSCWQTGPTSFVLGGASPTDPSRGEVAVIQGQAQSLSSVPGTGALRITSAAALTACAQARDGAYHRVDLTTGKVAPGASPSCRARNLGSPAPAAVPLANSAPSTSGTATALPPPVTPSYYEYYSYLQSCPAGATTACPLFQQGQATYTPATGGLLVLDFGAPCYVPNTTTYGAQLFGGQVCVPDQTIAQLVQDWMQGYESDHGAGTPDLTLAIGTSNSLNGVDPGYSLSTSQMQVSGQDWYQQLVAAVPTSGLAAPLTLWGASDMEQSSSGNWYSGTPTVAWVQGYGSVSPAQFSCSLQTPGFLADYGDDILGASGSEDGWTVDQVYQVAWGLPPTCALPEIYYSGQVPEWVALSQWGAANATTGAILFTGVMTEAVQGSYSPADGWSQLQQATAQSPPIPTSTEIGTALQGQPPQVTAVSPNQGPGSGGTEVTVSGQDLLGTQAVYFGSNPASSFTVVNANTVDAVSPPGTGGFVPVEVETSLGTSSATSQDSFYYYGSGAYSPLTPARIEDTRPGSGLPGSGQAPGPGGVLNVQVTGAGGVPSSGVSAVMVNLTVTQPTANGWVTAFPTGTPVPNTSNLDFAPGETRANLVEVAVGQGGQISIFNESGTTQLIVDVEGWYGESLSSFGPGLFNPITPQRIADTRSGSGRPYSGQPLGPGGSLDIQVAGVGAIPASGVAAVVLNLTVTQPTQDGYLTMYPTGDPRPLASNVNFTAGQTVCNQVVVPLGSGGEVTVYNFAGTTQVIADVSGWFAASGSGTDLYPIPPARAVDTRAASGQAYSGQTLAAGSTLTVQLGGLAGLPASGVVAVAVNVTVTNTAASGYLQLWPAGQTQPYTSELNWTPGQTAENLVLVGVGSGSGLSIYNGSSGSVDVIIDAYGWFGAG